MKTTFSYFEYCHCHCHIWCEKVARNNYINVSLSISALVQERTKTSRFVPTDGELHSNVSCFSHRTLAECYKSILPNFQNNANTNVCLTLNTDSYQNNF